MVLKYTNALLSMRSLSSITIVIIALLSLQWVSKKTKKNFLHYIGYLNFANDHIMHVSLQILVQARLLNFPNCLRLVLLLLKSFK